MAVDYTEIHSIHIMHIVFLNVKSSNAINGGDGQGSKEENPECVV